jgi:hypothetical protein
MAGQGGTKQSVMKGYDNGVAGVSGVGGGRAGCWFFNQLAFEEGASEKDSPSRVDFDTAAGSQAAQIRTQKPFRRIFTLLGWMMLIAAALRLLNLGTPSRRKAILESVGGAGLAPLKFQGDGTFQISIFSDLHFGESMLLFPCKKSSC